MLDTPGPPKYIVRVCWEHLAEAPVHEIFNYHFQQSFNIIPGDVKDIGSKWIVEVAAQSYGKVVVACCGGNLQTTWQITDVKGAIKQKNKSYQTWLACETSEADKAEPCSGGVAEAKTWVWEG